MICCTVDKRKIFCARRVGRGLKICCGKKYLSDKDIFFRQEYILPTAHICCGKDGAGNREGARVESGGTGGKYIPTAARSYVLGKAAGQKNLSKYSRGGKYCSCLLPVTCFSEGISTENI